MVSIDTYVRPYQLLTMLDHIEAGDDAVASVHATTLLLKKENEKKAKEEQMDASSSQRDRSSSNILLDATRCKTGSCNCDWATKEVCNHENANDGSFCFFECCCPYLPSSMTEKKQKEEEQQKSDEDTTEDTDEDATSSSIPQQLRYTYIQGEPLPKIPRTELLTGIGRRRQISTTTEGNTETALLQVYIGGHTHTKIEERIEKTEEQVGAVLPSEALKHIGHHDVTEENDEEIEETEEKEEKEEKEEEENASGLSEDEEPHLKSQPHPTKETSFSSGK